MWILASIASAGPLDNPDPDEMGGYHCVERPLGLEQRLPLGTRQLGDHPPGDPVFAEGLASSLLPFASDDALKLADKGKWIWAAPAVASLATSGAAVRRSCESHATTADDFVQGCTDPFRCTVLAEVKGQTRTFDRRPQVAAAFTPVEDAKVALGLVWYLDPYVFLPLTPNELATWRADAQGYVAVDPPVPWVEVEQQPEGWLVRVPRRVTCGCDHDLVRHAYWVAKDGRTCALTEPPVVLAAVKDAPACTEP